MSSLPRSSSFERQRESLSPMSRNISQLLPSRIATRGRMPKFLHAYAYSFVGIYSIGTAKPRVLYYDGVRCTVKG